MLEFNVTEQPNSIEELFAKNFQKLNKYPMDNEMSEMFVKLLLSKNSSYDIPEEEKPHLYKIMEKRISILHDYEVDDRVLLFLCLVCKSAGDGFMYCWYLQYEAKNRGLDKITFEVFAEIFGSGFPSDYGLQNIWNEQKVKSKNMSSDNLLDYPRAGVSLFKNNIHENN